MNILKALKRFGRGAVGLLIMGSLAYAKKDIRYIALTPIISMIGKYLRDNFKVKFIPF